jgi:hypothetical protein
MAIDYDKLAQQNGAISGGVDYDALAAKHGAISSSAKPAPAAPPMPLSGPIGSGNGVPVPRDLQSDAAVMGMNTQPHSISALTGSQEPPQGSSSLRVAAHELKEGAKGAAKGVLGTVQTIHNNNNPDAPFWASGINTTADNPDQIVGKGLEGFAETLAPGEAAVDLLPSTTRAGGVLGHIESLGAHTPVPLNEAAAPLQRGMDLSARGNTLPKVFGDLNFRNNAPVPLNLPEARDFYTSASALSGDEAGALKPKMKAQVNQLRAGLHNDLTVAADTIPNPDPHQGYFSWGDSGNGLGRVYENAIDEYRNASQLNNLKEGVLGHIGKWGTPAAIGVAGADYLRNWLRGDK